VLVVDGTFVQGLPLKEFAKGRLSKVPLLVDHDAFEGQLIHSPDM
jgi:hypothetical protein